MRAPRVRPNFKRADIEASKHPTLLSAAVDATAAASPMHLPSTLCRRICLFHHPARTPQVLTAAHVVANSTYMEIQLPGSPDKIPARVVSVAHETDLALVEVDTGFAGVEPLVLADPDVLPRLRDKVYVLGFPVGGNDLSITEGVVSRIEVQSYSHSNARVLAATVDAAINSGNSGGPVVSQTTGEVVGIAFQGYAGSDVENQGHLVPAPLIGRFMASVAAGLSPDAAGLPGLGVHLQHLQSPSARSELKMKAHHTGAGDLQS